jgi:predicted nucleic acid-binding protein
LASSLVDSNVLLDVITKDPRWFEWSSDAIEEAADTSRLVINPIVYAEVSIRYSSIEEFEAVLSGTWLEREAIPFEAAFLAGKCFLNYRKRGGSKTSTLPDFLIGAHAAVSGYSLITRDAPRYRTYFPKLVLISPT